MSSDPHLGRLPFRIDVITLFPDLIENYCSSSILGRGRTAGALDIRVHDLRDGATDAHRTVDDSPFGGGAGMVLQPEPAFSVVERADIARPLFLTSPAGRRFDEEAAAE